MKRTSSRQPSQLSPARPVLASLCSPFSVPSLVCPGVSWTLTPRLFLDYFLLVQVVVCYLLNKITSLMMTTDTD